MFTLKVIDDETTGFFRADTLHRHGGTDMLQAHAFAHLFPEGECPWAFRELVFDMAEIHGWEVKVRVVKREEISSANTQDHPRPSVGCIEGSPTTDKP